MVTRVKSAIILGILAFVVGFCFVAGGYVAHDIWRTVDDENVIWLVNRIGAGYAITVFVVLGFVTARGIEYLVISWWNSRRHPKPRPEE